jgi:hypothetical protein
LPKSSGRKQFTILETALLTSILNQEKLANELLRALAQGKGPLNKLVKKVSLEHAGKSSTSSRRIPLHSG